MKLYSESLNEEDLLEDIQAAFRQDPELAQAFREAGFDVDGLLAAAVADLHCGEVLQ